MKPPLGGFSFLIESSALRNVQGFAISSTVFLEISLTSNQVAIHLRNPWEPSDPLGGRYYCRHVF